MPGARTPLGDIALLFLRLGATAFGGPAAHIAMMEDEVVRRRGWLSRDEFLDYLGATNLIPGPNSTELAIHIGHARAGWPGLLVAGACFVLPATIIVLGASWSYVRYGALPDVAGVLYGVKPVVIAIIIQAFWMLARTALKTRLLTAIALLAALAAMLGVHELVVLAGGAVASVLMRLSRGSGALQRAGTGAGLVAAAWSGSGGVASAVTLTAAASTPVTLTSLFLAFAKIGAVLFGSGYVLVAFLRTDFVDRFGWITERQLLDAIAIGQITPGPLSTTATFIGYLLGGVAGAGVATIGMFLPAFVFVAISRPLVPRLRRSPTAGAALDGVIVASLALMAVVAWQLGRAALVDPLTLVVAAASLVLLTRFRVNSTWLVLSAGLAGWIVMMAGRR